MNIKELNLLELSEYLLKQNINFGEVVESKPAGEGNMNITLRLKNKNNETLVLKQSPPYCEKYPSIPAPKERALSEATFYQLANQKIPSNNYFPKVLHVDQTHFVLSMDDLGEASDFSFLYQKNKIELNDLNAIVKTLNDLHAIKDLNKNDLTNMNMRNLNHEYIFVQPIENTDFESLESITPGLKEISSVVTNHNGYKGIVRELGRRYLEEGSRLCHGDYYPASWLKTEQGLKVIDPEFAFVGLAEFDYGVMLGHLILSDQSSESINHMLKNYDPHTDFSLKMAHQFAGVEIMRRLIGVAQLPLKADLAQKERLLQRSLHLVLKGEL